MTSLKIHVIGTLAGRLPSQMQPLEKRSKKREARGVKARREIHLQDQHVPHLGPTEQSTGTAGLKTHELETPRTEKRS
ncbi:uncharacterized protein V6R79_008093 [Siganus canaliculatus]